MDIDEAIGRLLEVASELDLPAPLNPAGEAELDALRAAVAPLRLPDDLVRLWRRLQGGPPGMIDRLDLMPVSQAIEFRAIHDGPNALLTIAFESQWSRFVELDDPNGAGGGAVWEGDVGDFDLREVAPSLADLIDAVATAMELGIARPYEVGGFRILQWDDAAWDRLKAERWPERGVVSALTTRLAASAGSSSRGWIRATPVPAAPRRRSRRSASCGNGWTDTATISGTIRGLTGSAEGSGGPLDDGTGRLFVFVPPGADPFRLLQNGTPLELDVRPFDDGVDVGSSFDRSAFEAVATAVRREDR